MSILQSLACSGAVREMHVTNFKLQLTTFIQNVPSNVPALTRFDVPVKLTWTA